ncbi:MAG: exonuclease domain-containing protein [Saprospiraceae bacterium]
MQLNLQRELVFIDLETTGLNVMRDRIIQIGMIKLYPGNREPDEFNALINPGIPISEDAMAVHGITPKDLANKPTFAQIGPKIHAFIGQADLAGYNSNRFDIPMLIEEFDRIGIEFHLEKRRLIDVQRIFYKMEPRTLKAAYRLYCNAELEEAHDALSDVRATVEVFKGQLRRYENCDLLDENGARIPNPVRNDIQVIHDFVNDLNFVDATQKLRVQSNGVVVFNFGKYAGQPVVEVFKKDRNYPNWILENEFSVQVKQYVRKVLREQITDKR